MSNKELPTISLIGAGRLGRSLAKAWYKQNLLSIKQVFTRSESSSNSAVEFIGAGAAHTDLGSIQQSDILLLAVPDDQIELICQSLISNKHNLENTVVFHCSGVKSSKVLVPLKAFGATVASVHPIKSFANPESASKSFEDTYCGVEGDKAALSILHTLFVQLGGNWVTINAEKKQLYHCAAVFTNNYLVSLLDCAQELYQLSGIDREQSMQLMAPMIRETCENVVKFGTQKSLTGPIARGDKNTIAAHLLALEGVDSNILDAYKSLGKLALELKEKCNSTEVDDDIFKLLSDDD